MAYSAPYATFNIHNLAIFQALAYLESEANSKPCETLTGHIQNPAIVRTVKTVYSDIYQSYSGIFGALSNAYIYKNLPFSEFWS